MNGGKSLEEMREFMLSIAPDKKAERVRQLKERVAVAQKVSELQSDPRWEVWGRHIEAIRDNYDQRRDAAQSKLLKKFLLGDEYLSVKMEQASAEAAGTALTQALNIAKALLESGEQALVALNSVDNQG